MNTNDSLLLTNTNIFSLYYRDYVHFHTRKITYSLPQLVPATAEQTVSNLQTLGPPKSSLLPLKEGRRVDNYSANFSRNFMKDFLGGRQVGFCGQLESFGIHSAANWTPI